MPIEQREKIRTANQERPMTPERLQALREAAARMRTGITADSIAKAAESKRGRKQSAVWIRNRTQWRIGKKIAPDIKGRMKEAARRRCSTPHGLALARRAMAAARKAVHDAKYKDQLCLFVEGTECG
jgi:hypothetical protein